MKSILLMGAIGFGLACAGAGHAASFDCAKAATPMEKKICTTPALSKADDTMSLAYKKALGDVSLEGQTALRASERSFLQYADILCRPGQMPLNPIQWKRFTPAETDLSANCLEATFEERTKHLNRAVLRLGRHTFLSTITYRARAYIAKGDALPSDAIAQVLTLTQIDAPANAAEARWNVKAKSEIDGEFSDHVGPHDGQVSPDDSDIDIGVEVVEASPELIVSTIDTSTYTEGMAHPFDHSGTTIWLLKPSRSLVAADVFDASKPWATALAPVAQSHLTSLDDIPLTQLGKITAIDQIGRWRIQPDGLCLVYGQYDLGGYLSAATTTLSWEELRPYLRKDLPFDPTKIQVAPGN